MTHNNYRFEVDSTPLASLIGESASLAGSLMISKTPCLYAFEVESDIQATPAIDGQDLPGDVGCIKPEKHHGAGNIFR